MGPAPPSWVDPTILSLLAKLEDRGIQPGLERIQRLLADLGDPQLGQPCILVGGTNGKGSVAALIDAIARTSGYRVGLFTSPYLEDPAEQVRVEGRPCPEDLAEELEHVLERASSLDLPTTPFEALTAAAWCVFRRRKVDLAVVEVGLGGRLDATNVCDPLVSVVTTLARDHTEFLTSDLATIAHHKAGVFRPGRTAIIGWCGEWADRLEEEAVAVGALPRRADVRVRSLDREDRGLGGQSVTFSSAQTTYALESRLCGVHQAQNVAVAVVAAEALAEEGLAAIDAASIHQGVGLLRWPGRLETTHLPGARPILLDGAHNPAGAAALGVFLRQLAEPYDLLFGALADKDAVGMLRHLTSGFHRLVLTAPTSPRAWDPRAFQAASPLPPHRLILPLSAALEQTTREPGRRLVIAGSLRLVGEARHWLRQHGADLPPIGSP